METIRCRLRAHLGMTLVVTLAALASSFAPSVYGQSINLAWDASTDSSVAGYNIYRSQQSGLYSSTPLNTAPLTAAAYTDSAVQSGGTYYYVVTAVNTSGVQSAYSNEVQSTVPVIVTNPTPVNQPPTVNAGADQTLTLPNAAIVSATAADDGLPNGVLTYRWSVVSGNGVTFSAPNGSSTQVTFTAAGTYTLRVTVSDGQLSASDDIVVTVQAPPSLTLLVSKSGDVLRGTTTSIKESSSNSVVRRLELYIDQNQTASVNSSSLTYKWDLRKLSGTHIVSGKAYDSSNAVVATASVTVTVK